MKNKFEGGRMLTFWVVIRCTLVSCELDIAVSPKLLVCIVNDTQEVPGAFSADLRWCG